MSWKLRRGEKGPDVKARGGGVPVGKTLCLMGNRGVFAENGGPWGDG